MNKRKSNEKARLKALEAKCADKPHGTRLRYRSGCKCMLCRAANARYESERAQARKEGEWNGLVKPNKAQKHIKRLAAMGIGRRSIAKAAGVPNSVLHDIKLGRREHIRAMTERKILDIGIDALPLSAFISAARGCYGGRVFKIKLSDERG